MKKYKPCAYCGKKSPTGGTRDHVPPKSLFTTKEKKENHLITVPACIKCNNGAAKDDEHAKFLLGLAVFQMEQETPQLTNNLRRTVKSNNKFKSILNSNKKVHTQDTLTGIIRNECLVPINNEMISSTKRVFIRTTRGLYFHHFGYTLNIPANSIVVNFAIGVDLFSSLPNKHKKWQVVQALAEQSQRFELIPNVFSYWIAKPKDGTNSLSMVYNYRRSLCVTVIGLSE